MKWREKIRFYNTELVYFTVHILYTSTFSSENSYTREAAKILLRTRRDFC